MLLMMFNIGHQPEKQIALLIAQFLYSHYVTLDINIDDYGGHQESNVDLANIVTYYSNEADNLEKINSFLIMDGNFIHMKV